MGDDSDPGSAVRADDIKGKQRRNFLKKVLIAGAAVGGGALAGLGALYFAHHLPSTNSTSSIFPTTQAPQINDDVISRLTYLSRYTIDSIRRNASIINPYSFTANTTVGDILQVPEDFFSVYYNGLVLDATHPIALTDKGTVVNYLRSIRNNAKIGNLDGMRASVQGINGLSLLNSLSRSTERNDVKKALQSLNSSLQSGDLPSVQDFAALAEYQWNGLAREAYTSRNISDLQSQIKDLFNGLDGSVPYGDYLSNYNGHLYSYENNTFWAMIRSLSTFTRYTYGRSSVAQWLLDGSFANRDAIITYANSNDPFVRKWFAFFTPSAFDGYAKLSQLPGFDSSIFERYLAPNPFFGSGQLDTRFTTISSNPMMFAGLADGINWFSKGHYTTVPQILRHCPKTSMSVMTGPNTFDVDRDLQSFESLRNEAKLNEFSTNRYYSYSQIDPSNGIAGICKSDELLSTLRSFLFDRFNLSGSDANYRFDGAFDYKYSYTNPSFSIARQEYENADKSGNSPYEFVDFLNAKNIYHQLLLENIKTVSQKLEYPLTPYFVVFVNKGTTASVGSFFMSHNNLFNDFGNDGPCKVADGSAKNYVDNSINAGVSMLMNSNILGDETFFDILTYPNNNIAKYNGIDL